MKFSRRIAFAAIAAPLTLALAACNGEEEAGALPRGEPVAAVPAPQGSAWTEQVVRTEEGGWQVGNPNAPIKLVEYGSLTCPACAAFSAEASEPLLNDYVNSGRVSFEFRSFMIHGIADLVLTRMLECGAPTAAVPLADQVWASLRSETPAFNTANQAALERANALPPEQRLVALADAAGTLDFFAARGISRDQAATCLADFDAAQQLTDTTGAAAEAQEVSGTPTFFLNGTRVDGITWDAVQPALQRAGARDE